MMLCFKNSLDIYLVSLSIYLWGKGNLLFLYAFYYIAQKVSLLLFSAKKLMILIF